MNKEKIYNMQLIVITVFYLFTIAVLMFLLIASSARNSQVQCSLTKLQDNTKEEVLYLDEYLLQPKEIIREVKETEVYFTNYYSGDSCNSTTKTGSGLTTKDFEVNEDGFYTWNGMVVLASATYECINSSYGACKNYTSVPDGYYLHSYYDQVNFSLNGKEYIGVVLDSCGASYWNRELQTLDIFIANKKYAFGKAKGVIYE